MLILTRIASVPSVRLTSDAVPLTARVTPARSPVTFAAIGGILQGPGRLDRADPRPRNHPPRLP